MKDKQRGQPGPRFSIVEEDDAADDSATPPVPPRASAAESSLFAEPQLYEKAQGLAAMKDKQREQPGPRFSIVEEDDAANDSAPPLPPRASAADSSLCAAPQLYEPAQGLAAMKDRQRGQPGPRFSIVEEDDAANDATPPVQPRAGAP